MAWKEERAVELHGMEGREGRCSCMAWKEERAVELHGMEGREGRCSCMAGTDMQCQRRISRHRPGRAGCVRTEAVHEENCDV